jgi:hypothetical protein
MSRNMTQAKKKNGAGAGGSKKGAGTAGAAAAPAKPGPRRFETAKPPAPPEMAVCNAAGTLHHLTFLDAAKMQVS